jgi:hypothetical protein
MVRIVSCCLLAGLMVALGNCTAWCEWNSVRVDLPDISEYDISGCPPGPAVAFEGCGYRLPPGSPMLPTKTFLIGLPPAYRVTGIDVQWGEAQERGGIRNPGRLSEPVPLDGGPTPGTVGGRYSGSSPGQGTVAALQSQAGRSAWISGSGSLGGYAYVAVTLCPCVLGPDPGSLTAYSSAEIVLSLEADPEADSRTGPCLSPAADPGIESRARQMLVNFDEIRDMYDRGQEAAPPLQNFNYVIITTGDLAGAVTSSNFISWKTSTGYSVKIVLVTDPEIAGQPGVDLAEQIRNFLRAYYQVWGIEYVLMVGDYATVPMRYCYPNPANHTNTAGTPGGSGGEVPTDCYYADLSSPDYLSWDSDGDGYPGEYGEDSPDFMPEVYVGRIPTNLAGRITYALDKTVTFEQDTGGWKTNALQAGAFYYFTHELNDSAPCMDAAKYLSYIEDDIMSGWSVTHYSEQAGLETSSYEWPALTAAAFTTSWRTGQYAVVNWGAHGWTDRVARKVWGLDDGDGIPEADEISWPDIVSTSSTLDDDYPSIVTAASCLVGCPEPSAWDRMGIKMLVLPGWGPAVGVIASARSPYGTASWPPGGSESIIYEFNRLMIDDGEKVGQAFYDSKFYCTTNYGWAHWAEYVNMYTFNLWGDPSLTLEGIDVAGIGPAPGDPGGNVRIHLAAEPNPTSGAVTISYYLPSPAAPHLDVFDVLGRKVCSIAAPGGAGRHQSVWDGLRADGKRAASCIYWIRLSQGEQSRTVMLVRTQ